MHKKFLAAIAALKVTMSNRKKLYTSYNAAISSCVLLQSNQLTFLCRSAVYNSPQL